MFSGKNLRVPLLSPTVTIWTVFWPGPACRSERVESNKPRFVTSLLSGGVGRTISTEADARHAKLRVAAIAAKCILKSFDWKES